MSKAEKLAAGRAEVLLVDLGEGHTWWFPNLYVLLLLLRRSAIATIAFVEDSAGVGAFVGACSLENLLAALESLMPKFTAAARSIFSGPEPPSPDRPPSSCPSLPSANNSMASGSRVRPSANGCPAWYWMTERSSGARLYRPGTSG
jgi:hypothetical protein